jgi:hypothetical protein
MRGEAERLAACRGEEAGLLVSVITSLAPGHSALPLQQSMMPSRSPLGIAASPPSLPKRGPVRAAYLRIIDTQLSSAKGAEARNFRQDSAHSRR